MALKRKRSSPAFSSPCSDSSDASTNAMPFFYAQSKPVEALHYKPTWSWPTYGDQPSTQYLNSRTRKRHRDNRPDEDQIHANTMSRLFEAQRQHPHAEPVYSSASLHPESIQAVMQPQRSTLHSFWRIGQPPSHTAKMDIDFTSHKSTSPDIDTKCEDCDRSLRHEDAMQIDESVFEHEVSCQNCDRKVCDHCAVVGDARICLGCASSGG